MKNTLPFVTVGLALLVGCVTARKEPVAFLPEPKPLDIQQTNLVSLGISITNHTTIGWFQISLFITNAIPGEQYFVYDMRADDLDRVGEGWLEHHATTATNASIGIPHVTTVWKTNTLKGFFFNVGGKTLPVLGGPTNAPPSQWTNDVPPEPGL